MTVSLSNQADEPVSIRWRTVYRASPPASDAKPKIDYVPAEGTVVVAPGETTATAVIAIRGDRTRESNESVFVKFTPSSTAVQVEAFSGLGRGVIVDDD